MDENLPGKADTSYTPTQEDLREIAEFLRQRSLDESSAAGVMGSHRNAGVTIEANIPSGAFASSRVETVRQETARWIEHHSPDRFADLAHQLAELGYALSSAGMDAASDTMYRPHVGPYRQQGIWRTLTKAARLWDDHPDFKPLWAEEGA